MTIIKTINGKWGANQDNGNRFWTASDSVDLAAQIRRHGINTDHLDVQYDIAAVDPAAVAEWMVARTGWDAPAEQHRPTAHLPTGRSFDSYGYEIERAVSQ